MRRSSVGSAAAAAPPYSQPVGLPPTPRSGRSASVPRECPHTHHHLAVTHQCDMCTRLRDVHARTSDVPQRQPLMYVYNEHVVEDRARSDRAMLPPLQRAILAARRRSASASSRDADVYGSRASHHSGGLNRNAGGSVGPAGADLAPASSRMPAPPAFIRDVRRDEAAAACQRQPNAALTVAVHRLCGVRARDALEGVGATTRADMQRDLELRVVVSLAHMEGATAAVRTTVARPAAGQRGPPVAAVWDEQFDFAIGAVAPLSTPVACAVVDGASGRCIATAEVPLSELLALGRRVETKWPLWSQADADTAFGSLIVSWDAHASVPAPPEPALSDSASDAVVPAGEHGAGPAGVDVGFRSQAATVSAEDSVVAGAPTAASAPLVLTIVSGDSLRYRDGTLPLAPIVCVASGALEATTGPPVSQSGGTVEWRQEIRFPAFAPESDRRVFVSVLAPAQSQGESEVLELVGVGVFDVDFASGAVGVELFAPEDVNAIGSAHPPPVLGCVTVSWLSTGYDRSPAAIAPAPALVTENNVPAQARELLLLEEQQPQATTSFVTREIVTTIEVSATPLAAAPGCEPTCISSTAETTADGSRDLPPPDLAATVDSMAFAGPLQSNLSSQRTSFSTVTEAASGASERALRAVGGANEEAPRVVERSTVTFAPLSAADMRSPPQRSVPDSAASIAFEAMRTADRSSIHFEPATLRTADRSSIHFEPATLRTADRSSIHFEPATLQTADRSSLHFEPATTLRTVDGSSIHFEPGTMRTIDRSSVQFEPDSAVALNFSMTERNGLASSPVQMVEYATSDVGAAPLAAPPTPAAVAATGTNTESHHPPTRQKVDARIANVVETASAPVVASSSDAGVMPHNGDHMPAMEVPSNVLIFAVSALSSAVASVNDASEVRAALTVTQGQQEGPMSEMQSIAAAADSGTDACPADVLDEASSGVPRAAGISAKGPLPPNAASATSDAAADAERDEPTHVPHAAAPMSPPGDTAAPIPADPSPTRVGQLCNSSAAADASPAVDGDDASPSFRAVQMEAARLKAAVDQRNVLDPLELVLYRAMVGADAPVTASPSPTQPNADIPSGSASPNTAHNAPSTAECSTESSAAETRVATMVVPLIRRHARDELPIYLNPSAVPQTATAAPSSSTTAVSGGDGAVAFVARPGTDGVTLAVFADGATATAAAAESDAYRAAREEAAAQEQRALELVQEELLVLGEPTVRGAAALPRCEMRPPWYPSGHPEAMLQPRYARLRRAAEHGAAAEKELDQLMKRPLGVTRAHSAPRAPHADADPRPPFYRAVRSSSVTSMPRARH